MNPVDLNVNLEEKKGEKRKHQSKENKETLVIVYYIYILLNHYTKREIALVPTTVSLKQFLWVQNTK